MPVENAPVTAPNGGTTSGTPIVVGEPVAPVETKSVMDEFLAVDFSDDASLKAILDSEHKGLPDYKTLLSRHTTDEGKKFIANIRADYTRKTQELAAMRRQIEAERELIRNERESTVTKGMDALKAALETDVAKLDPGVPEDLMKLVEIETAKRMKELLEPQQKALESERQKAMAKKFVDEHPDMMEPRFQEILQELLKDPVKQQMPLEDAYWLVRGKVTQEIQIKQAKEAEKAKADKQERRSAFGRTTKNATVETTPGEDGHPPKSLRGALEIYEWYKAHPEAVKRK